MPNLKVLMTAGSLGCGLRELKRQLSYLPHYPLSEAAEEIKRLLKYTTELSELAESIISDYNDEYGHDVALTKA